MMYQEKHYSPESADIFHYTCTAGYQWQTQETEQTMKYALFEM